MKNLDERFRNLVSDMDIDLKKRARQASKEQQLLNQRVKRIRRALPDLQVAETLAWKLPTLPKKKNTTKEAPSEADLIKRWARLNNIPSNIRVNMENLDKVIDKLHIKEAKEKGLKKPIKKTRRPPKNLNQTPPDILQGILPPIQQAFLRARLDRLGEGPVMKKLHIYQESEVRRRIQEAMKHADAEVDNMDITRREKAILKRNAREGIEKDVRRDHVGIIRAAVDNMIAQQTATRLPAAPKHKIILDEQQQPPRKKTKRPPSDRQSSIRFSWGSLRGSSA